MSPENISLVGGCWSVAGSLVCGGWICNNPTQCPPCDVAFGLNTQFYATLCSALTTNSNISYRVWFMSTKKRNYSRTCASCLHTVPRLVTTIVIKNY